MELILYGALMLAGLGFLYFSATSYLQTKKRLKNGIITTAEVVDFEVDEGYHPVMQYMAKGKMRTFVSSIYSNPPEYKIGDKVNIVYDKKNAGKAELVTYWGLYTLPIITLLFSLPMLTIAGGFFLFEAGIL